MMSLQLKPWSLADQPRLVTLCQQVNRTYLSGHIPHPYTEQDAHDWLMRVRAHDGKDALYRAIYWEGSIIGSISAEQKDDVYHQDAEIGYYLVDDYRGQGFMTQAVRDFIPLVFDVLPIIRLTGYIYAPNLGSRRVLKKNGFQLEGIMSRAVTKGAALYDLCIYGKLR